MAYVEDEGHPCDVITEIKPDVPWRTLAWESCHAKQHFGISAFYSGGQIEIPDLFSKHAWTLDTRRIRDSYAIPRDAVEDL